MQYLALDKTVKLKKQVAPGGAITVGSASLNLDAPANVDANKDSTGISFMNFDESVPQNIHDEENYEVLLSVSIRRKQNVLRLNSKRAHASWDWNQDYRLQHDWFRSSNPKIKVEDARTCYNVYIDGTFIASRAKRDREPRKITHVQYWFLGEDQTQTALSYALAINVT